MKTKILIIACLFFAQLGFSQDKGFFGEFSLNFSALPRTKDMDGYLKNVNTDYKTSSILSEGLGVAIGYNFNEKFSTFLDCGINTGGDFANLKREQYKKLDNMTIDLAVEYKFYKTEKNAFSAKFGLGYENSTFNYNRKSPVSIFSASCENLFIPIALTWWANKNIGVILQYNAVVFKGDAKIPGVNYKLNNVPNISLNSISIGIRTKFGLKFR